MSRKGPRPHLWKIQGEIPHEQYIAWLRSKAQANYRQESWLLSFEEFQQIWTDQWPRRGRATYDLCMIRDDHDGDWVMGNVILVERHVHLKRQKEYKQRKHGLWQ